MSIFYRGRHRAHWHSLRVADIHTRLRDEHAARMARFAGQVAGIAAAGLMETFDVSTPSLRRVVMP